MTLARRMWLASELLALLVAAAFAALIIAVTAQRDATEREARSKDVTTASLQLEKLVSDVETSFLGISLTQSTDQPGAFLGRYGTARRDLQSRLSALEMLASDDSRQRARAHTLAQRIREYVNEFVALLIPTAAGDPGHRRGRRPRTEWKDLYR